MTIFLLCSLLKSRSFTEHSTSKILFSAQKVRNVNNDMTEKMKCSHLCDNYLSISTIWVSISVCYVTPFR